MRHVLSGKKAEMNLYMQIIAVVVMFSFCAFIGTIVWQTFDTTFQTTTYYQGDVVDNMLNFNIFFRSLDYFTIFIMMACVISVAAIFWGKSSPAIFFVVTFIEGFFLGLISYIFNILFFEFASNSVFISIITYFPRTILLCTNLHWYALVLWIVGAVALYAKRNRANLVIQENLYPLNPL